MPLFNPSPRGPKMAQVIRTDEKGSDVNLATYLLWDGFRSDYELAVVISNDSDLVEPIRVVRNDLGLPVGVVNPQRDTKSAVLQSAASFFRPLRKGVVSICQFPPTLTDKHGQITKPSTW